MSTEFDLDFDFPFLKELTEESGVPGYEDRVRDLVRREMEGSTDGVRTDAMGNVMGTIHGDSDYTVMVAAHGRNRHGSTCRLRVLRPPNMTSPLRRERCDMAV